MGFLITDQGSGHTKPQEYVGLIEVHHYFWIITWLSFCLNSFRDIVDYQQYVLVSSGHGLRAYKIFFQEVEDFNWYCGFKWHFALSSNVPFQLTFITCLAPFIATLEECGPVESAIKNFPCSPLCPKCPPHSLEWECSKMLLCFSSGTHLRITWYE